MAEAKKVDQAKLTKLLVVAQELHDKQTAVLEELNELIGGGAGIAVKLKTFQGTFDEAWCSRYAKGLHGRYVWRHAQDVPNIKRLVKALGLEELQARALRYIANDDPFLTRSRHPFGLFVSGINSYAGAGEAPDLELEGEAAIDCKHTPRCRTEMEHTRKKTAELRS